MTTGQLQSPPPLTVCDPLHSGCPALDALHSRIMGEMTNLREQDRGEVKTEIGKVHTRLDDLMTLLFQIAVAGITALLAASIAIIVAILHKG